MLRYPKLTASLEDDGSYVVRHENGKLVQFTVVGNDLEMSISNNRWLRKRLAHFNDNGTMEGY